MARSINYEFIETDLLLPMQKTLVAPFQEEELIIAEVTQESNLEAFEEALTDLVWKLINFKWTTCTLKSSLC